MSRITPLMTSLHEGHKAEERLKCIDNMLFKKCDDTKDTILQAFWWYRKYTKAELEKLEKIEKIVKDYNEALCSISAIGAMNEICEVIDNAENI